MVFTTVVLLTKEGNINKLTIKPKQILTKFGVCMVLNMVYNTLKRKPKNLSIKINTTKRKIKNQYIVICTLEQFCNRNSNN